MVTSEPELQHRARKPDWARDCVDIHSACYHQRPSKYLGSGLHLRTGQGLKVLLQLGYMPTCVAYTTTLHTVTSKPDCCWVPRLGPWSYCGRVCDSVHDFWYHWRAHWCQGSRLQHPVDVRGLCRHWRHADLCGLCCHLSPYCGLDQGCYLGPCLGQWPCNNQNLSWW